MVYECGHGYGHPSPDLDCPECRSKRSVLLGVCEVCFADFGERDPSGSTLFVDRLLWDLDLGDPSFEADERS